eukprot:2686878-Heterocapsa_arctica.AAC.1
MEGGRMRGVLVCGPARRKRQEHVSTYSQTGMEEGFLSGGYVRPRATTWGGNSGSLLGRITGSHGQIKQQPFNCGG